MNLKEIKDAARKAFSDQQSQDTEGGVPDAVSFIGGFLAGARHVEQVIDRAELIQTNREDVLPAAQEAAHYTWLDGRVQFLEDRNLTLRSKLECINQVNDGLHLLLREAEAKEKKLRDALEDFILEDEHMDDCKYTIIGSEDDCKCMNRNYYNRDSVMDRARQVLKEIGEE